MATVMLLWSSVPPARETLLLITAECKEKGQFNFQTYSRGSSCKRGRAAWLLMVRDPSVLPAGRW